MELLLNCPDCEGKGTFYVSDCCGEEPWSNGDMGTDDIGICACCREHCTYGVKCETCEGKGFVEKNENNSEK